MYIDMQSPVQYAVGVNDKKSLNSRHACMVIFRLFTHHIFTFTMPILYNAGLFYALKQLRPEHAYVHRVSEKNCASVIFLITP